MLTRRSALEWALAILTLAAEAGCGGGTPPAPAHPPLEQRFTGASAVKVLPAGDGWGVLLETPQAQRLLTVPARELVVLDGGLQGGHSFPAVEGWTLIDAAGHPSGDVSALYVRYDYADPLPLRLMLSRWRPDGSRLDAELPAEAAADASFIATFDRGRVVASGEGVYAVARWPGNAVSAYRVEPGGGGLRLEWATRVEPEVDLGVLGIIGGGYDNFRQGDHDFFVYLSADESGAYVAVPSRAEVLAAHDAAFGERLSDGADPARLDFGAAILTRLGAGGERRYARLLGAAGRTKSLLGMRAAGGVALLTGRVHAGDTADAWDAWILCADAQTGAVQYDRAVDVQQGDAFWDAAPAPGGGVIAVGSTGYTQNPSGLSVSDRRMGLAVLLDAGGLVVRQLALPRGDGTRGDEAVFVNVGDAGRLVVAGMLDGPGTHAEVRANGFVSVTTLQDLAR